MGHVDILADDGQRFSGLRLGILRSQRPRHGLAHVRGKVRGSLDNEFEHAFFEELHKTSDDELREPMPSAQPLVEL
jgi:hypothetical protein